MDAPMPPALEPYREALTELCRRYHVQRLEVFGSVAEGTDRPGESDIDLLVEFGPLEPVAYADAFFGLLAELEDLLDRKVDLVVDSAIRNPYFRAGVDESRRLLYAA